MVSLRQWTYAPIILLIVSVSVLGNEPQGMKAVEFRFTLRSFQPQYCMTKEYYRLYCKQKLNRIDRLAQYKFCLSPQEMNGHPDFDPIVGCQVEVPSGPQRIVQMKLDYEESGLGKPVYCNRHTLPSILATGNGYLCGKQGRDWSFNRLLYPETTGKDRFDEWYHDVPGVNKRIGLSLTFLEDRNPSFGESEGYFNGMPTRNRSSVVTLYDSNDPRFYNNTRGFFPLDAFTVENGGASPDPLEFQTVWPKTSHRDEHKFSFTTEFHSVFTYLGGEIFKFSGDDDVYVFINVFLELDLGGRHRQLDGFIYLDSLFYSTLVVNQTYSIDLFHAERQRPNSNFAITSTLVAPMSIGDIGFTGFDWPSNDKADFAFIGSLPAVEDAGFRSVSRLALLNVTESSQTNEVGYVLLQRKLLLNKGFIIELGVSISGTGSSGFSILLQNGEVANLPLTGRSLRESEFAGIGFAQGEKSLGLSVDLCRNLKKPVLNVSSCEQEIRLHANGQTKTFLARSPIVGKLADGRVHTFVLSYTAATQYLEVFIDDSLYMLQTKFKASDYVGTNPTTVGISIFQDSIVLPGSSGFEYVTVELHSFKVVVAEFRSRFIFTTLDTIVLFFVGAIMALLLIATIRSDLSAIWRALHSCVAFLEDATAIFLLVEKACELCPGTPSTDLFLIFFGVEILFQIVPHVSRNSPILRFLAYNGIEIMQLFLFLNLLSDTINRESAGIFVVYVGIQTALVVLDTINRLVNKAYSGNGKKVVKSSTETMLKQNVEASTSKAVIRRICNDIISTLAFSALPLINVFVYPRTSVFQAKWYQILVALNLWYRGIVIDSMVENMSEEEYLNAGTICASPGRAKLREEWKEWSKTGTTLATVSVGHTLLLHVISAGLAIEHLEGNPPEIEVFFCVVALLAIAPVLFYVYQVWKALRAFQKRTKYILEEPV